MATTLINGSNTFIRKIEMFDECLEGKSLDLVIHQLEIGDEGCVVWDAALVLLKYLLTSHGIKHIYQNHVIELGSGTGVVALTAAAAGAASVTVTDLPSLIPLIQHNIAVNKKTLDDCREHLSTLLKQKFAIQNKNTVINAMPLDWSKPSDAHDVCNKVLSRCSTDTESCCLLVADCVYYEEGNKALISTIVSLFEN